ncbi:hypothetical protein NBH15_28335, partial [Parabacteroides sp. W1-Q-101]|nr:hypothetical protein [Parabacteroides sp. W1-Q-101]
MIQNQSKHLKVNATGNVSGIISFELFSLMGQSPMPQALFCRQFQLNVINLRKNTLKTKKAIGNIKERITLKL